MKKIAIIGAGPCGLSALYHLSKVAQFQVTCFEVQADVGGIWLFNEENSKYSAIYKNLVTNLPKELMVYPDLPFSSELPSFMHHPDVQRYFRKYASVNNLLQYIQFETLVTFIQPADPSQSSTKWQVTVESKNEKCTNIYDSVIIANGHFTEPFFPVIPGLSSFFKGTVMHSKDYRFPETFKNFKVLVIGAGSSGVDIAIEASNYAESVVISHSKSRVLFPDYKISEVGRVTHVDEAGKVHVKDASLDIDFILFCTGYHYRFPFMDLKQCGLELDDKIAYLSPLYKTIVNVNYTSLYLMGMSKIILTLPLFDCQSQFILAHLTGKMTLPSKMDMLKSCEKDLELRKSLFASKMTKYGHVLDHLQWDYTNDLAQLASFPPLPPVFEALYNFVWTKRRVEILTYKKSNYRLSNGSFELL